MYPLFYNHTRKPFQTVDRCTFPKRPNHYFCFHSLPPPPPPPNHGPFVMPSTVCLKHVLLCCFAAQGLGTVSGLYGETVVVPCNEGAPPPEGLMFIKWKYVSMSHHPLHDAVWRAIGYFTLDVGWGINMPATMNRWSEDLLSIVGYLRDRIYTFTVRPCSVLPRKELGGFLWRANHELR